jgi:hydrogenase maturation protease
VGIGNPIMGDDNVGLEVAKMIKTRISPKLDIEVKELSVSGFRLVEEMLGFERTIIIDSHIDRRAEPGRIRELTPDHFKDTLHATSPHGISFATALDFYKNIEPERVPKSIRIFTIDITPDPPFSDKMSSNVQEAALKLTELIIHEIS